MRFLQILLVVLVLVFRVAQAAESKHDEITCLCSVFGQLGDAQIKGMPLLQNSANIEAECDANAAKKCEEMCKKLGKESAAGNNPDLQCQLIKNTNNALHPPIYSKKCDADVWTYAGLTAIDYLVLTIIVVCLLLAGTVFNA